MVVDLTGIWVIRQESVLPSYYSICLDFKKPSVGGDPYISWRFWTGAHFMMTSATVFFVFVELWNISNRVTPLVNAIKINLD